MTPKMKFSVSNIAWDKLDDEAMYLFLKKEEINNLEIAPTRLIKENPYEDIKKIKEISDTLLKKYNLHICSMQSILYGKTESLWKAEKEELKQYIKKAIDFASAAGIENIVFGCPKNRIIDNTVEITEVVKYFKELGDYAYSKNTILSLEANPTIYGTNFINTTEEAIELARLVNSQGFKINLDLGTIIENQENVQIINSNISLINHVHISMPYLKTIDFQNKYILEVIKILVQNNYQKVISIEMGNQECVEDVQKTLIKLKELV